MDSRDEGMPFQGPRRVFRESSSGFQTWTEPLGVLLFHSLSSTDPLNDPEIERQVQEIEQKYPILVGHVWQLIGQAKAPHLQHAQPADRLHFHSKVAPFDSYSVHLPLDQVELHELLQGERV